MIGSLQATLTKDMCEILRAALYFDVFKYPLTKQELFQNTATHINWEQFLTQLDSLLTQSYLIEIDNFILCSGRGRADLERRLRGNTAANEIMPLAYRYSLKIARFPFVEGVCLSGALSKNYYDDQGDIDFFIITKPGRLWICRTLLILRYKSLPKRRKKFWCVNYFISSDNLNIPDRNVFTATELAFLFPTVNHRLYEKMMAHNDWYRERFPNKNQASAEHCLDAPRGFLKIALEWLLSGKPGMLLDNLLLRITLKHWRNKYPNLKEEDFELQFRSRKDVCKRHTIGFQNKVLVQWEEKINNFEQQFNIRVH